MLSAQRILENIRDRSDRANEHILVFWCQILSNREEMCRKINAQKGDLDIVPIALRGSGFDNPNSILSDLNNLIRDHKDQFERGPEPFSQHANPIILLLLSHTAFTLPQISSLITLPDWFPKAGGHSIFVTIEDLTAVARGPLNSPESHIADLSEKVFSLETVMVSRMSFVVQNDRHSGQSLFSLIKRGDETYLDFLSGSLKYHGEVQNPRGFRPSLKENRCFTGRLVYLMSTTTSGEISKRAKALAVALGLPEQLSLPLDSLVSVLLRPTNREPIASINFARNLLTTVYASSQLLTAAAHSDDYSPYPILLLQSMSFNLRTVLDSLSHTIGHLQSVGNITPVFAENSGVHRRKSQ
jgi:hypothetical protein